MTTLRTILVTATLAVAASAPAQVVRVDDTSRYTQFFERDTTGSPSSLLLTAFHTYDDNLGHVVVSSDGGRSWSERATPGVGSFAQVSSPDSSLVDLIASAWTNGFHRRSTDGALTWGPAHTLPPGISGFASRYARVATSPAGELAVIDYKSSPAQVRVVSSTDGGATWPNDVTLAFAPAQPVGDSPCIAWLGPGQLLACWAERPSGAAVIRCARSDDAGATFGAAVELSV